MFDLISLMPKIPAPALDLNFAGTKSLDPRITFTRSSNATYFDLNGVLQTASPNVARFDHNPVTRESLGLLIEEQRTNRIRNNTMVGAVAGSPGTLPTNWFAATPSNGLTRQIVGAGTENGISYIDVRYSGTTSTASLTAVYPETATQVAALSGQTWTGSFYVSLVAGSTANTTFTVVGIDELNSGGTFLAGSNTPFTLTPGGLTGKRYSHTRTLNNASTTFIFPYVFFTYNSDVAIDITFRIGMPQLEQSAFATSVIPTTTATATRTADNAVMTGTNFSSWYRQDEGTWFASHDVRSLILCASNNTFAERQPQMGIGGSFLHDFYVITGGVIQANSVGTVHTLGQTSKVAYAIRANDFVAATNGTLTSQDTSGAVSSSVFQLNIGTFHTGGVRANGHIRRIAYYPQRLNNQSLQILTK